MTNFAQKYTVVHLINSLPDGCEFVMADWPLHVTLADVFAITGDTNELLQELTDKLSSENIAKSEIVDDEWFGDDKSVHVRLLKKTDELQKLHEKLIAVLERHRVIFNNPEITGTGFKPHSTVQKSYELQIGDRVVFDSLTLIDMFPDGDPYKRKVLGTVFIGNL